MVVDGRTAAIYDLVGKRPAMTEPNGARDQKFRRQWTPSVICWFRILRLPRSKIVIELAVVKHCAGQTWLCPLLPRRWAVEGNFVWLELTSKTSQR